MTVAIPDAAGGRKPIGFTGPKRALRSLKRWLAVPAVVAAAVVATPASAGLDFAFSFAALGGGSVRGEIFGLTPGTSAATDVQIFTQPSGFALALPLDLFTASNVFVASNAFTVSGGTITAQDFSLISDPASLVLNSTSSLFVLTNNDTAAFATSTGGITFTQVPEPGSALMLFMGLLGLTWSRRRR